MKWPHNTHKQKLTNTHIVGCILTEMRAKQTSEGGDGNWCVLALGGFRSSNRDMAPFKEWPQKEWASQRQTEQKYTSLAIVSMTDS